MTAEEAKKLRDAAQKAAAEQAKPVAPAAAPGAAPAVSLAPGQPLQPPKATPEPTRAPSRRRRPSPPRSRPSRPLRPSPSRRRVRQPLPRPCGRGFPPPPSAKATRSGPGRVSSSPSTSKSAGSPRCRRRPPRCRWAQRPGGAGHRHHHGARDRDGTGDRHPRRPRLGQQVRRRRGSSRPSRDRRSSLPRRVASR